MTKLLTYRLRVAREPKQKNYKSPQVSNTLVIRVLRQPHLACRGKESAQSTKAEERIMLHHRLPTSPATTHSYMQLQADSMKHSTVKEEDFWMLSKDLRAQYTEETSTKAECTVAVEDQAEVWAESVHAEKGCNQVIRVWKHSRPIAKVKYTDNYITINTIRKRQWCSIATISESWRNQKTSEKPNCSTLKISLTITKKT